MVVYAFGPQLNAFMAVGILSKLGVFRFVSLGSAAPFTTTSYYSTLNFTNFITQKKKTSWICCLDIAAFQDFKVFLLLSHACEDCTGVFATEK